MSARRGAAARSRRPGCGSGNARRDSASPSTRPVRTMPLKNGTESAKAAPTTSPRATGGWSGVRSTTMRTSGCIAIETPTQSTTIAAASSASARIARPIRRRSSDVAGFSLALSIHVP